jgi:hypothetical protein
LQLTNADRRTLLETFRTLAHGWSGDDSKLIAWTTGWAATLVPTFGFEEGLGRDVVFLGNVLRRAEAGGETARLARGGLAYLYQHNQGETSSAGPFGLLDDSFIAGYAAHSIREETGEAAAYYPPGLSDEEKAAAEAMFLKLWESPESDDGSLPVRAEEALAALGHLAGSGLFRRLRLNVSLLSRILGDAARPADHRKIARAALHYVVAEDDIIPDSLGLIGFLDDFFIADLAVGLIDDGRAPWMDLIDALVAAWPFLNMTSFGDGQAGAPVSEFLMVNSALACPAMRGEAATPLTHLVLPVTGPLPLLLGFFASLGELFAARQRGGSPVPFEVGQKVLLDDKAYIFEGCQLIKGQMKFGVGRTRRERGQVLRSIQWMPIDQLGRLVPADSGRSVRGRLAVPDMGQQPLNALDYLFLSPEPVSVPLDLPQVVVVTPVGVSREASEAIALFGQRLCDALPMGHLAPSGETVPWSPRFGATRPAVLIAPDLDWACEYVEEAERPVTLTVVDASGHNAGRLASLNRLLRVDGRVLVTVPEAEAEGVVEGVADPAVWEWTPADYESLCVEAGTNAPDDLVRSYEREVVRAASARIEVVKVETPRVDEAYRSLDALRRLAEARGEDVPRELEDALGRSWSVFCRLVRCPFRLSGQPKLVADLTAKIDALGLTEDAKLFLSPEERGAAPEVRDRLRALLAGLQKRNPKEEALAGVRREHPALTVVCGDVPLLDPVDGVRVLEVASALDQTASSHEVCHAVAGWFGGGTMKRLLRPPFATPLYLVLSGPELAWHRAFLRRGRAGAAARPAGSGRARFFPGVGKWPEPPGPGPGDEAAPADVQPPEAIETFLVRERRRRLAEQARPSQGDETVQARLVTFEGGHAFLTDDYRAKVATHLLAGQVEGQEAVVRLVPATGLRPGDQVLFLRGSSSDVIRQVADQSLPPGERERASLWRRTLLNYRAEGSRSIEEVWRGLREKGCPLSLATIENWFADEDMISPANIDRELRAILELTQSVEFREGLEGCRESIRRVRGEHLKASREIARRVVERAVAVLKASARGGGPIDLGEGIVLARVNEIDADTVNVRRSAANRLVEDTSWPA